MLEEYKLKSESFKGKDIKSLPDKPSESGMTAQELKAAFDRSGEEIIANALNGTIDCLMGEQGAEQIGAGGITVGRHIQSRENPHGVTAAQAGAYTKEEADKQIESRIIEIGAGDMTKNVYDPTGKKTDIFAYAQPKIAASGYLKGNNGNIQGVLTIPLAEGGTGATSASAARSNLGAQPTINVSGTLCGTGSGNIVRRTDTLLWSGSWASGTITATGIADYTYFKIIMEGQGTTVFAIKKDSYIRGIGGYSNASATPYVYFFASTFSGNKVTMVSCENVNLSSMAHTKCTVTHIYGVI